MKYQLISALVLAILTNKVTAFWEQGHLMVARVAYNVLQNEAPQALQQATQMLQVYSQANPSLTDFEGDYPFVECAIFADTIKSKGGAFQSEWHFINTPYLDQGGSVNDYPKFVNGDDNVANAIPAIVNWLTGSSGYQNSFVYQGVTAHTNSEDEAKSYALRLLIHYLGDIHQPLHAVALLDPQYPKGDAGGNFIHLPPKGQVKNLHSVWDSIIYSHTETPQMPYDSNGWNTLGSTVDSWSQKYTFAPTEYDSVNVSEWVNDSFELAKNNVYPGAAAGEALSQEYINTNLKALEKQIVLGGLRLATVIKTVFGSNGNFLQ